MLSKQALFGSVVGRCKSHTDSSGLLRYYASLMADVHVLAFYGEIDIAQKQSVEQELAQIERFGATATTILDLRDVRYVDTTFLNALCQLQQRLDDNQPRATLCIVVPRGNTASRLFAITELDRVFQLFEDISSARRYALELQRMILVREPDSQSHLTIKP